MQCNVARPTSGMFSLYRFGFMPGKGTTDVIFIMRKVEEKHQARKKNLYYAFVDLEKEFESRERW